MKEDKHILQPEGNLYNKHASKNPVVKRIVQGFYGAFRELAQSIVYKNVFEAGCGEAHMTGILAEISSGAPITASDISEKLIRKAALQYPAIKFEASSIYDLPHADGKFDLAVACEVLEHLDDPERGIKELLRVSGKYIIVSVPNEPTWRICNFLRGKYIMAFGNTPGHIQHWSSGEFQIFAAKHCRVLEKRTPFPWTILLCEKR